jgi:hypothetical protein
MKVIHVLKKIEQIDDDIKELRKMEKSLQRNKSFTTPIFMTIEKQINNLLGDKNKILELVIANPPEALAKEFDGELPEITRPLKKQGKTEKNGKEKKVLPKTKEEPVKSRKTAGKDPVKKEPVSIAVSDEPYDDIDTIPMLTQDMIDSRFDTVKTGLDKAKAVKEEKPVVNREDDRDVKLLDIALSKGTLNRDEIDKEREKKRVRFFRDNFPGSEY